MTNINSINITNNFLNIKYKSNDPPEPTKSLIGAWSEIIECGDNSFDLISLATALPQSYNDGDYDLFFSNGLVGPIQGWYENIYNNGKTYFISIGGLNASSTGWTSFLNILNDDTKLKNFMNACSCRNITGIDWDIENFDESLTLILKNISIKLKQNGFKIMLTILLGQPKWFKDLFSSKDDSYYDYVTLMLYNGGMYKKNVTGAGCDWDEWAELFLTNGYGGCTTPLVQSREDYRNKSNVQNINIKKIILGLRADDGGDNKNPVTVDDYKLAEKLVTKYNSSGTFLWVLQSGNKFKYINDILSYLNKENITECNAEWNTCNSTNKPCSNKPTCVASYCFKIKQKGTDEQCKICSDPNNKEKWPCNNTGFCEEEITYPTNSCEKYIENDNNRDLSLLL